ncbi:MAG: ferritin-like domain-containing protein [Planctomycetes bacterium]|nr:ferritin-like domain-containing protein [Planctomycetota bacterium]
MAIENLQDALLEEMRDVLSAEKQITKALKQMAKKASHEQLKEAFEEHLKQTEGQIERLEKAFEALDRKPRSKHCDAMEGLISEGKEIMEEDAEPEVRDAMMIAAAQKVEHYEIATYGTLCAWAESLGLDKVAKLLQETLAEEKETDEKLNSLAAEINKQAQPA